MVFLLDKSLAADLLRAWSESTTWQFQFGAFLIFFGVDEELQSRLVRRRFLDVVSAAPIGGLLSHVQGSDRIARAEGQYYISPIGGKRAFVRNMRVDRLINIEGLLEDDHLTAYQIKAVDKGSNSLAKLMLHVVQSERTLLLTLTSWVAFVSLLVLAYATPSVTWIGRANLLGLVGWSMMLRAVDRYIWIPKKISPSDPNSQDAALFLGHRNSGLILEGRRVDVARWTGAGLTLRQTGLARRLKLGVKAGTTLLILFTMSSIWNGSSQDQILFMALNLLGQANTWLGQRFQIHDLRRRLDLVKREETETRTHVYASVIKKFGNESYTKKMLPQTPVWEAWSLIVGSSTKDPKELWEECAKSTPVIATTKS